MRRNALVSTTLAVLVPLILASGPTLAADAAVMQPEALTWVAAAGLPEGAQMAVLYGDPSKEGPFTIRFMFPAGYQIATHSHPTDEFITVISGEGRMAFGEDATEGTAQPLVAGTFTSLPGGAWHQLWIDSETVLELHSTGPFGTQMH